MINISNKSEQLPNLTSTIVRMQMIQLGLNPFNPEDIIHFDNIQTEGSQLGFFARLRAAWALLFSNEVNNDLELLVLKKINSSIKTTDKDNDIILNNVLGDYKPFSSELTDKIVKAPVTGFARASQEYKNDILGNLKSRIATVDLEKEFELNYPKFPEELKSKEVKLPSKQVKLKAEEGIKLPIGHGSGKKTKIQVPIRKETKGVKGTKKKR